MLGRGAAAALDAAAVLVGQNAGGCAEEADAVAEPVDAEPAEVREVRAVPDAPRAADADDDGEGVEEAEGEGEGGGGGLRGLGGAIAHWHARRSELTQDKEARKEKNHKQSLAYLGEELYELVANVQQVGESGR